VGEPLREFRGIMTGVPQYEGQLPPRNTPSEAIAAMPEGNGGR